MSYSNKFLKVAMASLALTLAACGGGGSTSGTSSPAGTATTAPDPVLAAPPKETSDAADSKSDLDIASLVYSGQERTPSGFYAEPNVAGSKVVATTHLKNRDVQEPTAPVRFEMCTDDWNQAMEWSELTAARATQHTDLVETNTNDRYYEFVRANFANADAPTMRHRVFRCSYIERSQVDLDALSGTGGRLNQALVRPATVRELGEYLWQFSRFNNYGNVVLGSVTSESASSVSHELRMATLVRAGLSASCDRIDIVTWTRTADRATGAITRTFQTLRQFGARETAGSVELCAI